MIILFIFLALFSAGVATIYWAKLFYGTKYGFKSDGQAWLIIVLAALFGTSTVFNVYLAVQHV